MEGLRASAGTRFRIRLNGILNGCGRRGARTANSLGVMAIMYSVSEWGLDAVNAERYLPRNDFVIPSIAAGLTAFTYRLPAACTCACWRVVFLGG